MHSPADTKSCDHWGFHSNSQRCTWKLVDLASLATSWNRLCCASLLLGPALAMLHLGRLGRSWWAIDPESQNDQRRIYVFEIWLVLSG
jgi:hypothetical protein